MLYFYPTFHGASGTKTISPHGLIKYSDSYSDSWANLKATWSSEVCSNWLFDYLGARTFHDWTCCTMWHPITVPCRNALSSWEQPILSQMFVGTVCMPSCLLLYTCGHGSDCNTLWMGEWISLAIQCLCIIHPKIHLRTTNEPRSFHWKYLGKLKGYPKEYVFVIKSKSH